MDIFNRPPTIAEDTLQYTLHPGPEFHGKSAITTLATLIDAFVSSLLPNHVWHRDAFELKVVRSPHSQGGCSIEGCIRVGDSVDDEWCIVWLLREITRQWDVAVNVFDSDGDFLLIEAAEHLPAWVTPTNSENRVWLYAGRLHLVPLQYTSPSDPKRERRMVGGTGSDNEDDRENGTEYVSIADAINVVRNDGENTLATPEVEQAAFWRIQSYPDAARQHVHCTRAFVPSDIVLALSSNTSLIQKATEAFYTRDALQLRAANRMARFPPESSILTTVKMTRTAYAQLMGQNFHPPKVFGQWKEKEGSSEWRWRDIGMKIACGFEMIYQETKVRRETFTSGSGSDGSETSDEARKEALRRDPEYTEYMKKLQMAGYFTDEIEGSSLWKARETRAAMQFIRVRQTDNANRQSFASLVNSAILQARRDHVDMSHLVSGDEDSDAWLVVNEGMLNNVLARSLPASTVPGKDSMDVDEDLIRGLEERQAMEQASRLRTLSNNVETFVEGQGDLEGATFEDELPSDETEMSEPSDSDDERSSTSNENATAERQAIMDRLVPALEPSEYGKMPPSFHSNSQRVKKSPVWTESSLNEDLPRQEVSSQPKPTRPLIFPRDQFDGVEDSDDETEDEDGALIEGEEDEEDKPQIVGEPEVDMQEEAEEFLEFSRKALGISSEMWTDIIRDRNDRDAFIPGAVREGSIRNSRKPSMLISDTTPHSGMRPSTNSDLNSFEAVMRAMDAELSRARRDKPVATERVNDAVLPAKTNFQSKGKQKAEEGDDIGRAMDADLCATLQDSSDDEDQDQETSINYTLMKNFLESFKSQQGLPGPVGNLIGRLGWQLPRDES